MAVDNEAILLKDEEEAEIGAITANVKQKNIAFRFIKRTFDIIGSIIGIILILPITMLVFILNICTGEGGSIFYTQTRIGKNGKHFKMYKFRTMCKNADKILKTILEENEDLKKEFEETRKLKNDPRVTKTGKILRKTSLDEFPQFINVLKGDMSLVGPRPVIDGEIELFGIHKKEILSTKPGVTGYWAVNGRSNTSYEERIKLETYYIKNMSIKLDIKIILKTIVSFIKKDGAI